MKFDISKTYSGEFWGKIGRGIFNAVGSGPRKYWPWFLAVFSLLFLAALLLDFYLFLSLGREREEVSAAAVSSSGPRVDLSGLASAEKIIKEREIEFQRATDLPLRSDPSL